MPLLRNAATSLLGVDLAGAIALAAPLLTAGAASANSPVGVWIDHTGRGAVEITECGGGLCGHVVWVKDAKHSKTCRNQVLGNVKPVGSNTWDRGWIVDPDDNSRYSVELKPTGPDRLRVVGYMGSKLFSETMNWRRAPADLKRCDGKEAQEAKAAPEAVVAAVPAPSVPVAPQTQPLPPEVVRPAGPEAKSATVPTPAGPPPAVSAPQVASPAAGQAPTATPETEAKPRRKVASTSTEEVEPSAPKGKRRSSSRSCKLDLPYITLNYPCDAF